MKFAEVFRRNLQVKGLDEIVKYFYKYYAIGKNLKILDAGCGTGRHAVFFARNSLRVFALDNSEIALRILRKKVKSKSYGKWMVLKKSDIAKLPYSNGFFDVVVCSRVLHHAYRKQIVRWMREINRVLKKGGYLVLSVLSTNDRRITTGQMVEFGTHINIKDTFDPEIPHHFFTKSEIVKLLKNFKVLRTQENFAPIGRGYGKMLYYGVIAKKM